ncbi:NlpC/P60 family protein [Actinomadura vinacea]|uniref:NlpC/P60 family protein n=1 Tax=Actinomadura vinacea TaxID=115336 RepID=A0ABN3IIV5_9ACTN
MPVIAVVAGIALLVAVLVGAIAGMSTRDEECQPATATGPVSDIPRGYLALYRKAGAEHGLPWTILAAIGSAESDHGRSREPGVRSGENHAGAGGPMQFVSGTWAAFGVDGDRDGRKDRYSPADAIPGAARYLRHNGAPAKMRAALFAYNHSAAYVNDVLARARRYESAVRSTPGANTLQPAQASGCKPMVGAHAAPSGTVAKIIAFAMAQRGKRYVFGASGPDAWDCSGLVQGAYRAVGYAIPRTTFEQWPFGVQVPKGREQPGDLVFFNSGPGTSSSRPGHVGLVIGAGKMVAARCSTCRPNIGVESYRRGDWIGSTRPLLKLRPRR